jgi:hypothetical protein
MLRFTKLSVIGVLAGTLGLVGCGEDAGATGGTGGTGGALPACDDGPLQETAETETGEGALACVSTVPFDFTLKFNATPVNPVRAGSNDFRLQMEVAVDAETVNMYVDIAPEITVTSSAGTINATAGDSNPTPFSVVDEAVPCTLAFVRDEAAVMVTTVSESSWTLDEGGTLELTLEAITQELVALGLPVTLTTEGAAPSCEFIGDKPSVQFTAGTGGNGGGGAGGAGGTGGVG